MSQRETQIWDNESQCYRRAVLHEALTHIRLTKRMTGDFPIGHTTIAEPGVYEAHLNPHGAVSIVAGNGKLLGLKPGEFEWVATHAPTPAPSDKMREALKFASGVLHDQAARFHKECRCQLCESCIDMVDAALRVSAPAEEAPTQTNTKENDNV